MKCKMFLSKYQFEKLSLLSIPLTKATTWDPLCLSLSFSLNFYTLVRYNIFDITFQACLKTKTHNKSFHTSMTFQFYVRRYV